MRGIRSRKNGSAGGFGIIEPTLRTAGPSFLIVSLRYIGDVLLSTPLALSIKEHLPSASVDYLVFEGTEGVLDKNPWVRAVHTIPAGIKSPGPYLALRKKYDCAIGANPSDRTTIFCGGGGRRSVGFSYFRRKEWWKKRLLTVCRFYDDSRHIVPLILSQLEPLEIPPRPRVVMGFDGSDLRRVKEALGGEDYLLFHPYARRRYKYWSPPAWGELAAMAKERLGIRSVFTVSPEPDDRAVLSDILRHAPSGTAAFPEVFPLTQLAAAITSSRGFVGVDTVATHMAAALDVPTVALFGPTMTRHWGPWPNGCPDQAPYKDGVGTQRKGHVSLLQKPWPCVPCNRETCALSGGSRIECLETIAAEEVFAELAAVMEAGRG